MSLRIENWQGQCYDRPSRLSGQVSGVAKQVTDLEYWTIYTHCYGHALNLAAQDSIEHIKLMQDTLHITLEITNNKKIS